MSEPSAADIINAPWPEFPEGFQRTRIIRGDILRLGTLDQSIGSEAAQEFYGEPNPYDKARESAALLIARSLRGSSIVGST